MHIRQHLELAALVALHGRRLARFATGISETALEQYWVASKQRLDAWNKQLLEFREQQRFEPTPHSVAAPALSWKQVRSTLDEILLGEVLCRVWTAVVADFDRRRGMRAYDIVVRSTYLGHAEARNKALNVMVHGRGFPLEEAVELNRCRRRCERWTDMLLAHLDPEADIEPLAFDVHRVRDFADDIKSEMTKPIAAMGGQLLVQAAHSAFAHYGGETSPSEELNEQIAAAVMTCFHGELFDSLGLLPSIYMQRLQNVSSDAEGMIEELLNISGESFVPRRRGTRF